jgi:hypothetical protein
MLNKELPKESADASKNYLESYPTLSDLKKQMYDISSKFFENEQIKNAITQLSVLIEEFQDFPYLLNSIQETLKHPDLDDPENVLIILKSNLHELKSTISKIKKYLSNGFSINSIYESISGPLILRRPSVSYTNTWSSQNIEHNKKKLKNAKFLNLDVNLNFDRVSLSIKLMCISDRVGMSDRLRYLRDESLILLQNRIGIEFNDDEIRSFLDNKTEFMDRINSLKASDKFDSRLARFPELSNYEKSFSDLYLIYIYIVAKFLLQDSSIINVSTSLSSEAQKTLKDEATTKKEYKDLIKRIIKQEELEEATLLSFYDIGSLRRLVESEIKGVVVRVENKHNTAELANVKTLLTESIEAIEPQTESDYLSIIEGEVRTEFEFCNKYFDTDKMTVINDFDYSGEEGEDNEQIVFDCDTSSIEGVEESLNVKIGNNNLGVIESSIITSIINHINKAKGNIVIINNSRLEYSNE